MAIRVSCSNCGTAMEYERRYAGQQATCVCGARLQIPNAQRQLVQWLRTIGLLAGALLVVAALVVVLTRRSNRGTFEVVKSRFSKELKVGVFERLRANEGHQFLVVTVRLSSKYLGAFTQDKQWTPRGSLNDFKLIQPGKPSIPAKAARTVVFGLPDGSFDSHEGIADSVGSPFLPELVGQAVQIDGQPTDYSHPVHITLLWIVEDQAVEQPHSVQFREFTPVALAKATRQ